MILFLYLKIIYCSYHEDLFVDNTVALCNPYLGRSVAYHQYYTYQLVIHHTILLEILYSYCYMVTVIMLIASQLCDCCRHINSNHAHRQYIRMVTGSYTVRYILQRIYINSYPSLYGSHNIVTHSHHSTHTHNYLHTYGFLTYQVVKTTTMCTHVQ